MAAIHLVAHRINGMDSIVSCPLCGFITPAVNNMGHHFNQWHNSWGKDVLWTVQQVNHPQNPMHSFWFVSTEPLTEEDRKNRDSSR